MPYSKDHKQRTRKRVVSAARTLFSAQGFDATSIDEIMSACNMTRGAFYAHFESKGQLYQEAMISESDPSGTQESTTRTNPFDWLDAFLHGRAPSGSQWEFLATDVASKEPQVREVYAAKLKSLRNRLRPSNESPLCNDRATLSSVAMVVGIMAISKSMDDEDWLAELMQACQECRRQLIMLPTASHPQQQQ